MCKRFVESNVPSDLRLVVHYDNQVPGKYNTVAKLLDRETDKLVAFGYSKCSANDQPKRSIGRAIAVGRAVKQLYNGHRV